VNTIADKVHRDRRNAGTVPEQTEPAEIVDSFDGLGGRLRSARQQRGLSLREVARQLDVSASFVSQIETGKSQPSVATLYAFAQLLKVSIDELFSRARVQQSDGAAFQDPVHSGQATSGGPSGSTQLAEDADIHQPDQSLVNRARHRSPRDFWPATRTKPRLSVTTPVDRTRLIMDTGVIWYQLTANTGQDLDFMEVLYPPGSSSTNDGRMLRHNGFEYGYLIDGELEVTYGLDIFVLRPGHAIGFDSSVGHLFRNHGAVTARGIWTVLHQSS
jgi:transcriptional regulator with XRE-family HTH domain